MTWITIKEGIRALNCSLRVACLYTAWGVLLVAGYKEVTGIKDAYSLLVVIAFTLLSIAHKEESK